MIRKLLKRFWLWIILTEEQQERRKALILKIKKGNKELEEFEKAMHKITCDRCGKEELEEEFIHTVNTETGEHELLCNHCIEIRRKGK
jgi:late competence protein required for DNA uptake (superfamily II DNA/RNA helicase)